MSLIIPPASETIPNTPIADDDGLTWLPAWRLQALIAKREISPVEVTEFFLRRIEELDPLYHAFRGTDAKGARAQAKAAEKSALAGEALGPLHGVPVAIKEHIAVKGMAWHNLKTGEPITASRDAIEVERLRAAGAVIFGVTVAGLTAAEFGDSDRQPLNPWNRNRICGDSSSGSACAAAAALTPLSIAVDGLGSIRLPAAYCGLVGLMATHGRVASVNWTELTPRLLSNSGSLTRDVRDAATILTVLAGPDGRDFGCLPDAPADYLTHLDQGTQGMRLVWSDDFGFGATFAVPESPEVIATVRQAAQALNRAGATIEPMTDHLRDVSDACMVTLTSDPGMSIYLRRQVEEIESAREMRGQLWRRLEKILDGKDFIICPTAQQIAPTRREWAQHWKPSEDGKPSSYMSTFASLTGLINLVGWPAISLPAGFVSGMPVGLQIIGRPNSEARMLQLAQSFFASYQIGRPALK